MTAKNILTAAILAATAVTFGPPCRGATLTGTIHVEGGTSALGAMLTMWNEAQDRKETVYADADGHFALHNDFGGKLNIRARLANFDDAVTQIEIGAGDARSIELTVTRFATPEALSDALTASAHTAKLPWKDAAQRSPFVSQCNYCHQVGNAFTRTPRDESQWRETVDRMQTYFAMLSATEAKTVVHTLALGFDGKPVKAELDYRPSPVLAHAKVEQWLVGDAGSFIHDADVADDDNIYGTDEGNDLVWVLDRKTNQVSKYPIPSVGLPRGGMFAGMSLPVGIFTGEHGPHSMAQTPDGRIWITNALSSSLASFDPKTHEFKLYPLGGEILYPHTIRADKEGILWFTANVSDMVVRFDPKSESFRVIRLPSHGVWRWITDQMLPTVLHAARWFPKKNLPLAISQHKFFGHTVVASAYGIDVDPKDGGIWVAQMYDNYIVRIDPQTFAVTAIPTPHAAPRRPRFDAAGILWIPSFDEGILMRFDPETRQFENFNLPLLADGQYEVPYALAVNPKTQDVWITANASDRILRFDPRTHEFISYPSPTRTTVIRDLAFTSDGRVCNSISNLPAPGMEDGLDSFICFDPIGQDKDRAAIAAMGKTVP
ncbi:MAG: hypothetical protein JOY95_15300 [Silvibacterium sp.]|nr:hypothetical protein [Silvibacterium sp.]